MIWQTFNTIQNKLTSLILDSKQKYYAKAARKLAGSNISAKYHWFILTSFLTNVKIPCIPPMNRQDRCITDLKQNTEVFQFFS